MLTNNSIVSRLNEIDWDFTGHVPTTNGTNIHQLHWYPATFPSALPGTLIDVLGSNSNVFLDPFSGSGTAPIEAWFRGKKAYGLDSNSSAIEISKAKIFLIDSGSQELGEKLISDYSQYRENTVKLYSGMSIQDICERNDINPKSSKWFIDSVLIEIAVIKNWIVESDVITEELKEVVIVILSSLLHKKFSIARKCHYTYFVDDSKLTDYAMDHVNVPLIFKETLKTNFILGQITREEQNKINPAFKTFAKPSFNKGIAQSLVNYINSEIDLVVTSPPYFGMNDYVRSQYLTWLIFQWVDYDHEILIESGSRRKRQNPSNLISYLNDMENTFNNLYFKMKADGYLAIILGQSNGSFVQEKNPVNKFWEILIKTGFSPIWKGSRRVNFRKINYIPYRNEVLWVFRR